MKSRRTSIVLALFAWPTLLLADRDSHVGTWELVSMEMSKREGQEYPVHRLILTADGKYLNSANRGGPISVNYKLNEDQNSDGWYSFLIETSDDHKFGRAAGLRINKTQLIMTYFDGRVLTYTKISEVADKELLVSPEGKNVTVKPNKTKAEAGTGQPATRSESKSEGGDKPPPESEGRSR